MGDHGGERILWKVSSVSDMLSVGVSKWNCPDGLTPWVWSSGEYSWQENINGRGEGHLHMGAVEILGMDLSMEKEPGGERNEERKVGMRSEAVKEEV